MPPRRLSTASASKGPYRRAFFKQREELPNAPQSIRVCLTKEHEQVFAYHEAHGQHAKAISDVQLVDAYHLLATRPLAQTLQLFT